MIIARFGGTWAGAYVFPTLKASDDWAASRAPVTQKVSGADGEFDFFDEDNYPVDPFVVTKRFTIEGSSYANVETLLNTSRDETIARGIPIFTPTAITKLWGVWRDGSTHVWTWAKCIGFKAVETITEKTSVLMTVETKFRCSKGLWFGETEANEVDVFNIPGGGRVSDSIAVNNVGNTSALVRITATPTSNTLEEIDIQVVPSGGGGAFCQWNFDASVPITTGVTLTVDARTYSCITPAGDVYADLTVGEVVLAAGGTIPQVAWLWLPPGAKDIDVEAQHSGGGGTLQVRAIWWHTYVL